MLLKAWWCAGVSLSARIRNKGPALELLTPNANELNKDFYDSLPLCSGCFLTFFLS